MDYLDCPFCARIVNDEFDADRSNSYGVVFEPLNPVTPGHTLVVCRSHVERATASSYLAGRLLELACEVALRLNEDTNLITSNGPLATQTVKHLHFHVVPRRADDGLLLPWSGQARA